MNISLKSQIESDTAAVAVDAFVPIYRVFHPVKANVKHYYLTEFYQASKRNAS